MPLQSSLYIAIVITFLVSISNEELHAVNNKAVVPSTNASRLGGIMRE